MIEHFVSAAEPGVDFTLPSPLRVSDVHNTSGRACLNLTVIDDDVAEAEECLVLVVETRKPVAPVMGLFCIKDNDGKLSLSLPITSLPFSCCFS